MTHRSRPPGRDGSSRSRPTSTGSIPAPSSGVGAPSPPSTRTTPGAVDSSSTASALLTGRENSRLAAMAWPTNTGTLTQVAVTAIESSWRILRVSRTSFHSSDV